MKNVFIFAGLMCLVAGGARAECTYGQARSKSIEVTNLQAALGRESLGHVQKGDTPPAALDARADALEADLKPLREEFAAMLEKQALTIQDNTPVDPSFCQRYAELLTKHAPEGYTSAPITLTAATPLACKGMDSTTLWKRYADAMQAQTTLLQSGRITQAQALELTQKFSLFGTEMSTKPEAACARLQEIEGDIAAFSR